MFFMIDAVRNLVRTFVQECTNSLKTHSLCGGQSIDEGLFHMHDPMWRKFDVEIITCVHTIPHVAGIRVKIAMGRYYFIEKRMLRCKM
jgi:hypothetical protein